MEDAEFYEYLRNPILYPQEFKDWVSDFFATNVPKLHVSQIFGFKLQSINMADDITTLETPSTTAFGDMATVGPSLTGLSNGFYLVLFGAYGRYWVAGTNESAMSISVDGVAATTADEAVWGGTETAMSAGRAVLKDLTVGNHDHSIVAKYRYSTAAPTLENRWLHALKVVTEDA